MQMHCWWFVICWFKKKTLWMKSQLEIQHIWLIKMWTPERPVHWKQQDRRSRIFSEKQHVDSHKDKLINVCDWSFLYREAANTEWSENDLQPLWHILGRAATQLPPSTPDIRHRNIQVQKMKKQIQKTDSNPCGHFQKHAAVTLRSGSTDDDVTSFKAFWKFRSHEVPHKRTEEWIPEQYNACDKVIYLKKQQQAFSGFLLAVTFIPGLTCRTCDITQVLWNQSLSSLDPTPVWCRNLKPPTHRQWEKRS